MLTLALAADAGDGSLNPFTDALVRNGAIGLVAAIFIYATILLYRQKEAAAQQTIARIEESHAKEIARLDEAHGKEMGRVEAAWRAEVERSNRLERELSELNGVVKTEYAGALVRATEVMREYADVVRNHRS